MTGSISNVSWWGTELKVFFKSRKVIIKGLLASYKKDEIEYNVIIMFKYIRQTKITIQYSSIVYRRLKISFPNVSPQN